jgi:hypothetical protein
MTAQDTPTQPTPVVRKLLRSAVGALWSLPLRFVTVPALVGAMVLAAGEPIGTGHLTMWHVTAIGVVVGVVLRFFDGLLVEFAVFPALIHLLKGRRP